MQVDKAREGGSTRLLTTRGWARDRASLISRGHSSMRTVAIAMADARRGEARRVYKACLPRMQQELDAQARKPHKMLEAELADAGPGGATVASSMAPLMVPWASGAG